MNLKPSPQDDSPFITPRAPSPVPSRPLLSSFRGDGSVRLTRGIRVHTLISCQMRAGTQTLIQALQALPWTKDPDNDDDIINHSNLTPATDSESDEDDKRGQCMIPIGFTADQSNDKPCLAPHLASSIHTIYRPLARSRKHSIGPVQQRRLAIPSYAEDEPISSAPSDDEASDDDADDFELMTPRPADLQTPLVSKASPLTRAGALERTTFSRTGSMATVRLQRRAMLAEKLREIYDLDGIEEVRAGTYSRPSLHLLYLICYSEMPCWLLRSIREYPNSAALCPLLTCVISLARLHVFDQYVPMFLCAYAVQRGVIHLMSLRRYLTLLAGSNTEIWVPE